MTARSDPERLLEGNALSDEDRRALSAYGAEAPGVERRARVFEGLSRELGQRAELASAGRAARWGGAKLKLLLGSASLLATAIGVLVLWPRPAVSPSARSQPAAQVASPILAEPSRAAPPPAAPSDLPASVPELSVPDMPRALPAQPQRSKPKRSRGEPAARASGDLLGGLHAPLLEPDDSQARTRGSDPVAELALLARARRALLTRPAHALEFTEAHARDFPAGTFGEEREVLAIEALLRLGLDDEAKQRALAFDQHFPDSAHRAHLARMIQTLDPQGQ